MVGFGKTGALVLAFVAPFWLQGCNFGPDIGIVLEAFFFPYVCVPQAEVNYLNSTVSQEELYQCVSGLDGKVANATYCCIYKYYIEAVPPADDYCCNEAVYAKLVENMTNETLKKQTEKTGVEFCHNYTKNLTIVYEALEKAACAPTLESTTHALGKEAIHVLYESELGKVKELAAERVKEARKSKEIGSNGPAGAAAVFLIAGAVAACLAYGLTALVKRARAQPEKESAYNQLLA